MDAKNRVRELFSDPCSPAPPICRREPTLIWAWLRLRAGKISGRSRTFFQLPHLKTRSYVVKGVMSHLLSILRRRHVIPFNALRPRTFCTGSRSSDRLPVYGIYGSVNGAKVHATPASETGLNLMSAAFAKESGIEVRPFAHRCTFANGLESGPLGTAFGDWQFEGEFLQHRVQFVVLPETSRPVVLGADFLMRTETLDTHWHRIREGRIDDDDFHCLHICDDVPQSVIGTLAKQPVLAVPATSCEMNIVSQAYVALRDLEDNVRSDDCSRRCLKLADGTYIRSKGRIHLPWRFGNEGWMDTWGLDFDVVEDCRYDVILGKDVLYKSDAFITYEDCFKSMEPSSCTTSLLRSGISKLPFFMLAFRKRPSKFLQAQWD